MVWTSLRVRVIPHQQQRYNTIGDWQDKNGELLVLVSQELASEAYFMLVAIHEIVEALLCKWSGVTDRMVTEYDLKFNENYSKFEDFGEPGDQPDCPYLHQHCIASGIERILAAALGVNWGRYESKIEEVMAHYGSTA